MSVFYFIIIENVKGFKANKIWKGKYWFDYAIEKPPLGITFNLNPLISVTCSKALIKSVFISVPPIA